MDKHTLFSSCPRLSLLFFLTVRNSCPQSQMTADLKALQRPSVNWPKLEDLNWECVHLFVAPVCMRAQLCLTLCDIMDCGLPSSSVCGISQARILEWVAISFSGDLPDPGIKFASPVSPALQVDSLLLNHMERPCPSLPRSF